VDRAFWRALPAYQSGDDDEIAATRKEYDRQVKVVIEAGVCPFGKPKGWRCLGGQAVLLKEPWAVR
jgi:hypothetical protein